MNPRAQLERYGIEPKKSLGQNFLHDPNVLEKIASSVDLSSDMTVLEIGAGMGSLTEVLARRAGCVVAVEIDRRFEPILAERLSLYPNVRLLFDDILKIHIADVMRHEPYVVAANIPYYISSAIIRHLLETSARALRLVLTVQLEVAERLVAKPGNMSLLSVSAQYYGRARVVMRLNPAVFYPRPDVMSAVVRIDTYAQPPVEVPDEALFFAIVRAGFSQKRKQLKNALADGLNLDSSVAGELLVRADIDPRRRAETLSLQEWAALTCAHVTR
jgi:16S rRNA (adenine1518-N6/adenine1519-N6)-dimethyltransferase